MAYTIDPAILEHGSPTARQREVIQAVIDHGGQQAAARALGVRQYTVSCAVKAVEKRAAAAGYAPGHFDSGVAPGYRMGKVTIQRGPGGVERVWERQHPDADAAEEVRRAMLEVMAEQITPLPSVPLERITNSDLLNVYTFTDYHFNMLAWGQEAGDDWDMDIAARTLRLAFRAMVDATQPAGTCVIAQLGDFGHTDSFRNATPTSGHELDADSRYPKAVRAMLYALRDLIEYAATRHDRVIVLLAEGNHDPSASVHFREAFAMFYDGNDRIEVITDPLPYYAVEWGKVMLGWHHGHLSKNASLPLLFATDFSEVWGRTKYRVIHTGHYHHRDVKEYPGVEVYQHPTLSASDAYAARHGFRSQRRAIGLTYHRAFGEVGSVTITPEMLG